MRFGATILGSLLVHAGIFVWAACTLEESAQPRLRSGKIAVQILPAPASPAVAPQESMVQPTPEVAIAETKPAPPMLVEPATIPPKFEARQPEHSERSAPRLLVQRTQRPEDRSSIVYVEADDRQPEAPAIERLQTPVAREPRIAQQAVAPVAAAPVRPALAVPRTRATTNPVEAAPPSRPSAGAPVVSEGVQTLARLKGESHPVYPYEARRRGLEGRVMLAFRVGVDGAVSEPRVDMSSGHALLDEAALEFIRQLHYEPARRGGQPIATDERLAIRFSLY